MRILITGVRGQLVRSLVERASGRPEIDLLTVGRPDVDLEVPGNVGDAIRRAAPDLVILAAAYTDVDCAEDEPERAFRINSEAAGEAAAAARELGVPIVQISTDYVFDGTAEGPYSEATRPNPLSAYGRSKLAGEEAVRAANPNHLILRTAWVYSPFGRNFVRTMFDAAERHDTLRVVNDQWGNPSCALDLADGLLAVADRWRSGERTGLGGTYHLAGTGVTSWHGLAAEVMAVRRQLGLRVADMQPIGSAEWPTKAPRPSNSTLDSGKFARDFGFEMPDWQASVATVVRRLAAES